MGAASSRQFPTSFLPEVAFAGKSNVGKSSLINTLLNRKHLVKTSSTPGKTRQINFFLINGLFRLVDLPGYGYSKASKTEQAGWESLIEGYLRDGSFLRGVVLIIDARHAPSPLDGIMLDWLRSCQLPHLVVANKIDKLKRAQIGRQLAMFKEEMALEKVPLGFSAKTRAGRITLAAGIAKWIDGAGVARG